MKNTTKKYFRGLCLAASLLISPLALMAQNSLPAPGAGSGSSMPAPGSGGSFRPNPPVGGPNGLGWNPGPANPAFGGPMNGWYSGWNTPAVAVNPVVVNPNQGVEKVMACGYDAQGNWDVLPLVVAYQYNGVQYDVTVLDAWNPWTDMWDRGVDMPAYNTSYYIRGITYNFYAPLSTGTYYFNL